MEQELVVNAQLVVTTATKTKKPLLASVVISVVVGLVLILSDLLFFGNYSQLIMDSYAVKPTVAYLLASVIYGGVIEEVNRQSGRASDTYEH